MKVTRVAILGAGNGGMTAAADLSSRGFEVTLYQIPSHSKSLEVVKKEGKILLQEGTKEEFYNVDLVTTDIEEAIKGAQIIMLTIPGFAIESFAKVLAPVVDEEQVIFLNGAASMGCIRFINEARRLGINKKITICETNSLTYGTRAFASEARVELSLRVKKLFLAAYPSSDIKKALEACSQIYDGLEAAENIWQTTLENGNPEVHPGPALLNAGRIDYSKGEFWLYREGITEHTANIIKAVEKERLELGKAFGFNLEDAIEGRFKRGYFSTDEGEINKLFNHSTVYSNIKGPISVTSRYFTEDISTGLVLWSSIGKAVGVDTPNIDAIITLGSSLLQTDFYKEGLTLDKLGLDGLNKEQLIESVNQ